MKKLTTISLSSARSLAKLILISLLAWNCTDDNQMKPPSTESESEETYDHFETARRGCQHDTLNYNLNVILRGDSRKKIGFIAFRQFENETQLIHLYTWVHGLEPNTSYVLQRAVDTTLEGDCSSTNWLTLGEGLTPKSIVTNSKGAGYAELYRSVAAIPVGSTFDIHFQILKESNSQVVLSSDCYEYTVH